MSVWIDGQSVDRPTNRSVYGYVYDHGRIRCTHRIKTQLFTVDTNTDGVTVVRDSKNRINKCPWEFFTSKSDCEEAEYKDMLRHLESLEDGLKKYKSAVTMLLKRNPQLKTSQAYSNIMIGLNTPL